MDIKVRDTQTWLNTTYEEHDQWRQLDPDGLIGWNTIYGMIRGLQIELGITALSDNFGDGTMAELTALYPVIDASTPSYNMRRLAQSALWCHGFPGGYTWGTFDDDTNDGIKSFMYNSGLVGATDSAPNEVTPKMLKGLLTLDAYSLISGGTSTVREAQQWINRAYFARKQPLLPCDGVFTRGTQQGLVTVIQYELGLTDAEANGNFGPGTKAGLQAQGNLSAGDADGAKNWVRLFQSALRMNGYDAPLNGVFDGSTVSQTQAFQTYAELNGGGNATFTTWASLLISTGDDSRPGTASDMATQLTTAHCADLYAAGYRTVGRYLSVLGKRYKPKELDNIFDAGLETFPIMQEANTSAADFSYEKGLDHGVQALQRLRQLGFTPGGTVFFSVDFDATDSLIDSNVIPFFQGINQRMTDSLGSYKIGIYGTRNVCRRVIEAGLAEEAFIASLSWGWGGNLGFPLPPAWSYDQIWNGTLPGSQLEIDKNVQSSRANPYGQNDMRATPTTVVPVSPGSPATMDAFDEDYYWYLCSLMMWADQSSTSPEQAREVALFWLAQHEYNDIKWGAYAPKDFSPSDDVAFRLLSERAPVVPSTTYGRLTHWAATVRGYLNYWGLIPPTGSIVTVGDLGGWALDLAQAWDDYVLSGTSLDAREWIGTYLGTAGSPKFDEEDLVADVDGYLVAWMLQNDPSRDLDDCVRAIEVACQDDPTWRYREFITHRFDGDITWLADAGRSVFAEFWSDYLAGIFITVEPPTAEQTFELGLGFMDALARMAGLESK